MYHHIAELPAALHRRVADIADTSECIEWTGWIDRYGYGLAVAMFQRRKYTIGAHRLSYLAHRGPIPAPLVVDHLCHNRRCINPRHLDAVTHAVNVSRPRRAPLPRPDYCRHGHEWATNTYIDPRGYRECRQCQRDAKQRYRARRVA